VRRQLAGASTTHSAESVSGDIIGSSAEKAARSRRCATRA
jgi:hypothetical protein